VPAAAIDDHVALLAERSNQDWGKDEAARRSAGPQCGSRRGAAFLHLSEAVESRLEFGMVGRDLSTIANRTSLARTHALPELGARRLSELTAGEVERWLAGRSDRSSTDTVKRFLSILRQSIGVPSRRTWWAGM
jgi:hypothetical protein